MCFLCCYFFFFAVNGWNLVCFHWTSSGCFPYKRRRTGLDFFKMLDIRRSSLWTVNGIQSVFQFVMNVLHCIFVFEDTDWLSFETFSTSAALTWNESWVTSRQGIGHSLGSSVLLDNFFTHEEGPETTEMWLYRTMLSIHRLKRKFFLMGKGAFKFRIWKVVEISRKNNEKWSLDNLTHTGQRKAESIK